MQLERLSRGHGGAARRGQGTRVEGKREGEVQSRLRTETRSWCGGSTGEGSGVARARKEEERSGHAEARELVLKGRRRSCPFGSLVHVRPPSASGRAFRGLAALQQKSTLFSDSIAHCALSLRAVERAACFAARVLAAGGSEANAGTASQGAKPDVKSGRAALTARRSLPESLRLPPPKIPSTDEHQALNSTPPRSHNFSPTLLLSHDTHHPQWPRARAPAFARTRRRRRRRRSDSRRADRARDR